MNTLQYTYNGLIFAGFTTENTATLQYTYNGLIWFTPLEVTQTFTPIITWIL